MTDTLPRPAPSRPARAGRSAARPGLLRAGLPAAAWAGAAGFVVVAVPVLLLWAADSRSAAGAADALRTVTQVWLLAHGAALHVPGGDLGLTPLGLVALPLLLVHRAARHAAGQHEVRTLADGARLAAGVAGPYALALTAVALLSRSDQVRPDAVQALVGASLLGLAGAGVGVARGAGLGGQVRAVLPARLLRVAPAAGAALLSLLAAGAVVTGASLAVHGGRAADLAAASTPGLFGGVGLLLLGVLLVPTAVVWGACYLAGPGFAIGAGTSVGPFGVSLGAVPAVPLLAALPGPVPVAVGLLLLAVPLGAGLLAGRVAQRRGAGLGETLLAGPLAGLVAALLAAAAGGPLGGARLAHVGPSWWQVGLAVTVEVAAGAGLWHAAGHRRGRRGAAAGAAEQPATA